MGNICLNKKKGGAENETIPQLRFVYDSPAFSKHQCACVFERDSSQPLGWVRTNRGNYYKNVRNEWATLVTTPPYARFQDALAFTRSLGDLHLHVYGVSSVPETVEYDLEELHKSACNVPPRREGEAESEPNLGGASLLLVCTDGVWDNWKFEDIVQMSLQNSWVSAVRREDSAESPTQMLMKTNLRFARSNFGNQADNMTAIVCYILSENQQQE